MTGDGIPSTFDDHSATAEKLLRIFEDFADEFSARSVPVHLTNTLREGKYLKGKKIGQRPERFVEEQLIWPVLAALDYEFWSQPHGFPKWDTSRPDFAVQNFECGVDCAVVGEVKTPNKFEYAATQIREYLRSDLGEPTVGFATDGIRWTIEARPEKSEAIEEIVAVDFDEVFRQLPSRHEEEETYQKHAVRRQMLDAELLRREEVEERVHTVFE